MTIGDYFEGQRSGRTGVTIPPQPSKSQPPGMTINGKLVDFRPGQAEPSRVPAPTGPTVVGNVYGTATRVRSEHEKFLDQMAASRADIGENAYRAALAALSATLDEAETQFQARKAIAASRVEEVINGLAPDGDSASETRRSRYWDGERRAIDNAKSPVSEMQNALANANDEQFAVLVQELPRELESRGLPGNVLNGTIASARPELANAQAELRNLEQCEAIVNQDLGAVRRGIESGRAADARVLVDPSRFDPDAG
jgi:hypothetical protein